MRRRGGKVGEGEEEGEGGEKEGEGGQDEVIRG
jgi:hypothetical protein